MAIDGWQKLRLRAYLTYIGMKRRLTLGVRAVLIDGEKIYLVRHTYIPGWHFPGGGVEPGEDAETAAGRELAEESAYRLAGRPELFGFYHSVGITGRDHVAVYLCRRFETAREFAPNHEIAEFGWFRFDAVPEGTTEATRARLREIFEGAERPAKW